MSRYFFNVHDGYSSLDRDGTELRDIYAAQGQAIQMAGEILRDMGAEFWGGTAWRLEVADEHGQVLFVLRFSAEELLGAPDVSRRRPPDDDDAAGPP